MEMVTNFKYLGVVLQLALGLNLHIDHILVKTASMIVCLGRTALVNDNEDFQHEGHVGSQRRDVVYLRIVYLSKNAMIKLDRCKTLYLKAALGVSKNSSNTYILDLTEQKTLCEDLRIMGYMLQESAWREYAEQLEERRLEGSEQDRQAARMPSDIPWLSSPDLCEKRLLWASR